MDTDSAATTRVRAETTTRRRPWRSWAHLPLTVVTWAVMLMAVWLREGHLEHPGAPLLVFTALQALPLLARTRWPLPVLIATVVASAAQLVLLPQIDRDWDSAVPMAIYQPVPVAVAVAAFTVALRTSRLTAWVAGGCAAGLLSLLALITHPVAEHLWTNIVMVNLVLDGTVVGVLVAGRRERMARERRERAEQTRREVEAERLRIARELHDVLAHHLTLVNAQASVAEYLVRSNPDAAVEALSGLAKHTRQALDEVRATVGLLRQHTDADDSNAGDPAPTATDGTAPPLPTLDDLPQLIATVRSAGTVVDVEILGSPTPLTPRGELAAYRLIQETLTNATKHAPGAPVAITLEWDLHHLRIRVVNPTPVTSRPVTPARRGGHGLLGMAERIKAAGGVLDVHQRDSGHFTVTATLPTEPPDSPAARTPSGLTETT